MHLRQSKRRQSDGSTGSAMAGFSYIAMLIVIVAALATPAFAMIINGSDIKNETVTGKDIRDGSLGQRELAFDPLVRDEVLVAGRQFTTPMTVPSDRTNFTPIGQTTIANGDDVGFIINWHVALSNSSSTASLLTVRVAVDGVVQDGSYPTTVPAGSADSTSGAIILHGLEPKTHQIELQVQSVGSELNIGTRAIIINMNST